MAYRQSLIARWVDINGATRAQALNTQANPGPAFGSLGAVLTAFQNASNSGLLYAKLDPIQVYGNAPVTGNYPSVTDYASLQFRTAAETSVKINIPAPKDGLFMADTETVDPTSALFVAIRDAVFAAISDANGNPVTVFVSGRRCKLVIPKAYGA